MFTVTSGVTRRYSICRFQRRNANCLEVSGFSQKNKSLAWLFYQARDLFCLIILANETCTLEACVPRKQLAKALRTQRVMVLYPHHVCRVYGCRGARAFHFSDFEIAATVRR